MNSNELYGFVGKCLALDDNPEFREEIIEKSNSELIDWGRFVLLCSNHLILPVIYLKFKFHNLLSHIPSELADHLREIYELNVSRNTQIQKQLSEIVDTLNKNKIKPIFLKGAANLLDGIYSDVGERIMSDIDFLVSEKEYFTAAKLLKEVGYLEGAETHGWSDVASAKHYPRLYRADCVADIEIHRIPVDRQYTKWFNTETIEKEKKTVSSLDGCFVQSDRHKIIHNFIHSQLVNEGSLFGIVSLREIYDLYLYSRRFPLEDALTGIKSRQKAIAYFAFAGKMLGLDQSFYPQKNLSYHLLLKKHNLNLSSTIFRKSYGSIVFVGQRIFVGYIGLAMKTLYSKEKRAYFYRRIKDRKWYANHLKMYTNFFKGDR